MSLFCCAGRILFYDYIVVFFYRFGSSYLVRVSVGWKVLDFVKFGDFLKGYVVVECFGVS